MERKRLDINIYSLAEIIKNSEEHILDLETGRLFKIDENILDAIESDYYDDLSVNELEVVEILKEVYNGSKRFVQVPKISEGDIINIIMEIRENLDDMDELKEKLLEIASSEKVYRKIRYLIDKNEEFEKIWNYYLWLYTVKKAKAWLLSLGFEINQP
ncbi:MAG: hypothetical protein N2504_00455 [candidate division WOR-3 bacterium]|nr:hypothetical protein [candidate division WOR-3 bacterium]MCX7947046.1 hypothetical protein [candidate division WOR-3 bacterium]MDW8149913.1 hypothetical protein [candidate division WOR-3 bacterium]